MGSNPTRSAHPPGARRRAVSRHDPTATAGRETPAVDAHNAGTPVLGAAPQRIGRGRRGSSAGHVTAAVEPIEVELFEPGPSRRPFSAGDVIRLLVGVLLVAGGAVLAEVARSTIEGIEADLARRLRPLPGRRRGARCSTPPSWSPAWSPLVARGRPASSADAGTVALLLLLTGVLASVRHGAGRLADHRSRPGRAPRSARAPRTSRGLDLPGLHACWRPPPPS